ncbi:mitotic spindle assembly checkpoint protein MAD2A [Petromyzon marinus]|uniref:Mitotic spindle assembly checkpoint protein MAD2A n=1 Tax=Petromyzon marinus TaxID=7757 RepID=A0AAJ7XHL3_PETMA|nr:mitotic spindle assembly checkpoint protein MAD2A [Petromyzon marinus]
MAGVVTREGITLRGSSEIVAEYFFYGLSSILYQRGVYPVETFQRAVKYGMSLYTSTDPKLVSYLTSVTTQLKEWLVSCTVQKVVLVLAEVTSGAVLERWQFDIHCDKTALTPGGPPREKSLKEINDEMKAVIVQITATVTFLPLLQETCSFNLLVYTDTDSEIPTLWETSGPLAVEGGQEVRLRSFSTSIHSVGTSVAYKTT